MPLRISCRQSSEADELAGTLVTAGYDTGVHTEPPFSTLDDENVVHVVQTDAPAELVTELLQDFDAQLEITDPMSGTKAVVDPTEAAPS